MEFGQSQLWKAVTEDNTVPSQWDPRLPRTALSSGPHQNSTSNRLLSLACIYGVY
jgi:hypothetical protein